MSKRQETIIIQLETYQIIRINNFYKLIGIDLSRQKIQVFLNKNNITRKLEEDHGVTMFFIAEKEQKIILNFSLDSLVITE